MAVDALRHLKVFDPGQFANRRVDVIGAGATGSRVVLELAKLGIQNIHVWDDDVVAEHNIANQVFGNDDIGKLKVEALAEFVQRQTGTAITMHPVKVLGGEQLGSIVFLLTDTMESRKAIWEKSLKYKAHVALMVETRMGADSGRIYAINPCEPSQIQYWEGTMTYTDAEAETSACGAATTVGATAACISSIAVWHLIRWFSYQNAAPGSILPELSTIVGLQPLNLVAGEI
jgi:molybdopterin/thiamine biosynthesis adenylyltransferase